MTFTMFTLYAVDYDLAHHKQRPGQAVYNAMADVRPDLAEALPAALDPFYDDTRLSAFWTWVGENW